MTNEMEPSQCRCCLSSLTQGLARDLYATYVWLDHKEVYSNMLRDCFNIVLSEGDSSAICEPCVSQLRSALGFKQQVLQAEENFTVKLESDASVENWTLTHEFDPDESDFEDKYLLSDAERTTPEPVVKEEKEVKEAVQRWKWPLKCEGGRSQKIPTLVKRPATSINSAEPLKSPIKKKEAPEKKISPNKESLDIKWVSDAKQDKLKNKENLETILKYSNAVPFKKKTVLGFICAYCDTAFPDPADLRTHTDTKHVDKCSLSKSPDITQYNVKLDVSNLNCSLCDEKMDNLSVLKQHLVKMHGKVIHSDTKQDHLLQFKLKKGDVYNCALCSNTYETFKMLKQHMNKHYPNYSCGKCEDTFSTRRALRTHSATHEIGSFECQYCDKVFPSEVRRQYHEKTSHTGTGIVSNCPHCNVPFRSYYQRNQHLVKVHNAEPPYKCNACSKGFLLRSFLMLHVKRTHLMEKDVQCAICSNRFFGKKALRDHMVSHSGERKYSCEVFHKCYARKSTLREHMRIHNNDRRFRCKVCAMTFVQKGTLKAHLLSNHGIKMAACDSNFS